MNIFGVGGPWGVSVGVQIFVIVVLLCVFAVFVPRKESHLIKVMKTSKSPSNALFNEWVSFPVFVLCLLIMTFLMWPGRSGFGPAILIFFLIWIPGMLYFAVALKKQVFTSDQSILLVRLAIPLFFVSLVLPSVGTPRGLDAGWFALIVSFWLVQNPLMWPEPFINVASITAFPMLGIWKRPMWSWVSWLTLVCIGAQPLILSGPFQEGNAGDMGVHIGFFAWTVSCTAIHMASLIERSHKRMSEIKISTKTNSSEC